ncbi:MAG: family 78 glycoside hydrolase catalytic domain [Lachnospiraceae bacterium]|nr:family 78 glycoside hydrolase catalytic domain [Lachnospiraceae bacterium]
MKINNEKERTDSSGWMTIPKWITVQQVDTFGRERAAEYRPQADAPENLHVLVRGTIILPVPKKISGADSERVSGGTADVMPGFQSDEEYELLVAADDHYQIWINGVYRGQGPAASYPEYCYYDSYPIILYPGSSGHRNEEEVHMDPADQTRTAVTIALHLYYHGRISRSWTSGDGRFGVWVSMRRKDEPQKELAHCDESWRYQICKAYRGGTAGYDTQFLENFDSRLWPEGWEKPGFDINDGDTGLWGTLVPALWADYTMMPRPIQMLEERAICPEQQWKKSEAGQMNEVFDFGREITGTFLAEAAGPEGERVVIRYGEELEEVANPDGCSDNFPSVRWDMRCGCAYQEIWTLGRGVSRFHPYDYKGFRYVQLVYPETVKVQEERAWVRHYPMQEDACTLKCVGTIQTEDVGSDAGAVRTQVREPNIGMAEMTGMTEMPQVIETAGTAGMTGMTEMARVTETVGMAGMTGMTEMTRVAETVGTAEMALAAGTELEQIFDICKNAVRCCSQDGYLDCPTREKGQYLGDALITGRSQVWLTGSTDLLRKCIGDFISSQSISPSMMAVAPGSVMQEIADFSLLFPLLPLTDYEFTADKDYLACCYLAVKLLTESFLVYQRPDGLLENAGDLWNLVDWPENLRDGYDFALTRPVVGEGCHNVINALWYGANQMQEQMEEILGLPKTGRTAQIADSYHAVFYREGQHLFADSEMSDHCSLHANLYAAYFGLLPKEAESAYIALLRMPERVCGAFPAYFALKSAAKIGKPDVCFKLMTRSDSYGWRNMLREGASASFEVWGKEQKWNTSLCHGWSSGFIPLFIEEIAGLHPDPSGAGQSRSAGHYKADAPGSFSVESGESERIRHTEDILDGLRFSPPGISGCPDFVLQVPWKGRTLRIVKHGEKTDIFVIECNYIGDKPTEPERREN